MILSRNWLQIPLFLILFLISTSTNQLAAADGTLGTVRFTAGKSPLENEPVSVEIPETGFTAEQVFLIETADAEMTAIPAQIEKRKQSADLLWWIPPGKTAAGKTREFQIHPGTISPPQELTIKETDKAYQIRIGDHPVLSYNYQHIEPPKPLDPLYGRSAHIHPIWTPGGKIVSDEFPPDHAHQSGQFLAFTKAVFEGRPTNFWEIKSQKGRVRFKNLVSKQVGPVFAELIVTQEHVDLTGESETPALLETWGIRVWNQPAKDPAYWMYDITSDLRCATESPLNLPEYHYGGMAIRGGRGWTKENCEFLNSNGKTRANGNHDRARWCDISGRTEPDTPWSGFTILTSPDNFRFPEPVRIHPSMPYMVFTPCPLGDWEIDPGKPHISHYRFLVHDGPALARTDAIWQHYAKPPKASIQLVAAP